MSEYEFVFRICVLIIIHEIIISEIIPSTRTNVDISNINKNNKKQKNNFEFTEHPQITIDYLWKDGIHLQDLVKSLLGQNCLNRVSRFLWKIYCFLTGPDFQEIKSEI